MSNSLTQETRSQSQEIMIFVLVLAMSGLEGLISEIMPELEIGLIELSISTFWFVPLTLVILFPSWWAALAVPLGELVFSDLLLGEFGGLGEFEEVLLKTVGIFIAARMVQDPKDRPKLVLVVFVSYLLHEIPATFIDIFKVWVGVEELEAVEGLPQSIVILESIDLAIEYVISGIIFGALPALALIPRLHGRIEPLMGMKPRQPGDKITGGPTAGIVIAAVIGFVLATVIAVVSEAGFNIVEWEPEFLDSVGEWFIWVGIGLTALVAALVIVIRASAKSKEG